MGWLAVRRRLAEGPGWLRSSARLSRPRMLAMAALVLALLSWLAWERCGLRGCPNVERLISYQPGGASVLLDRSGVRFATLAPVQRVVVQLESLPPHVPQAFVAIEDKRFYEHGGVDWRRVGGAFVANLKARRVTQGFSTITMQLARNVWPDRLPGQQRTLRRKLQEVRVAREIEDRFDKAAILELYLNHIYFGGGAYGIEAASRHYFRKPAARLTLPQAALLAAIVKGPSVYDPRRRPERARARRDLVLRSMEAQGRVTGESGEAARRSALGVRREPPREQQEPGPAPYFRDAVRRVLEDRFGEEVYTAPLRIHTTLDPSVQRIAEQELAAQLAAIERGRYGRFDGPRFDPTPEEDDTAANYLQGAVVVLDPATGDVRALIGGRDFRQSAFDRATRSRRQAGSAFKPFVYAAALADGYVTSQRLADEPLRMELEGGEVWEPRNFDGEFEGVLTLREALVRSKNVPTARLAAAVGTGDVARLARFAGVRSPIPEQPAMALGTASVTPLELTAAYTAFAGSGQAVAPRLVTSVETAGGEELWAPEVRPTRVVSPGVAYVLTDMLRDAVERGTGVNVRRAGYRGPAAGKTGTTNEAADVWFVGYTPRLVAGVWIGFDRPREILPRATGGRLAAPVWGRIMRRIHARDGRTPDWQAPTDVVALQVDPATGLVLAEGCRPAAGKPVRELFIEGKEPAATCPRGLEDQEGPGAFARVLGFFRNTWHRVEVWASRHFGREETAPVPFTRDRYLGAPRLPRVDEVPAPEISPEVYEIPRERFVLPPELEPLAPETVPAGPDTTILDTITRMPLDTSLIRPDTMRRDTRSIESESLAEARRKTESRGDAMRHSAALSQLRELREKLFTVGLIAPRACAARKHLRDPCVLRVKQFFSSLRSTRRFRCARR